MSFLLEWWLGLLLLGDDAMDEGFNLLLWLEEEDKDIVVVVGGGG